MLYPRRPACALRRTDRAASFVRRRRVRVPAFTMIEVILVMVIIGMTASIGMVRFVNAQQNYRLESAAKRVKADLELCRARAIERGSKVYASFDVNNETYACGTQSEVAAPGTLSWTSIAGAFRVNLNGDPYRAGITKLDGANAQGGVAFDMHGKPDCGLQVVIAKGTRERRVIVDVNSGRASIQ